MTWIWLSAIVIMIGAEIDAEMEGLIPEQRGAPQPLPMRAAVIKFDDSYEVPFRTRRRRADHRHILHSRQCCLGNQAPDEAQAIAIRWLCTRGRH